MSNFSLNHFGRSLMLGIALAISAPVSLAFAQDIKTSRDDIRQYQNRLDQIKTADTTRYASDLSQISSWIDEALILIGKDENDKVKTLAMKIGVYIDYVEASLERDSKMKDAMEAEAELKALKAEYGKLDAMVQQLTAEEEVLQKKLADMTKK